jgi:hypothetical protein
MTTLPMMLIGMVGILRHWCYCPGCDAAQPADKSEIIHPIK